MTAGQPSTSFRPRSAYLGHLTVDSGDGALLIEPEVVGELRAAAARAGHRPAGGLLYGHAWHDDEGGYTVVDAFIQAGSATGLDRPETVSELRSDAALRFPDATEVGWWRSAPRPGGAQADQDPGTWPADQRPAGVGLVVHADGAPWDASGLPVIDWRRHAPESAATRSAGPQVAAPETGTPPPREDELSQEQPTARELLVSPMRTMGPPALSPDPDKMWRPKTGGRRRPAHRGPWWREAHRVVAALIIALTIVAVIAVLVVLSPLF